MNWVIEFRNGSYFQNLKADKGGPLETAQRFLSKREAEKLMNKHVWIYASGGMAVSRG